MGGLATNLKKTNNIIYRMLFELVSLRVGDVIKSFVLYVWYDLIQFYEHFPVLDDPSGK